MSDLWHIARQLCWIGVAAAGVCLSGLYSGMEIGCYRLSEARLRLEAERRGGLWRRLLELTRDRQRLICLILIGNSTADYVATAGMAVLLTERGLPPGQTELYATLILGPLIFVVGEMIPKALFQARGDSLTVRGTPVLEISRYLFTYTGLVGLTYWATRGVMRLFGQRGETTDLFGPRDRIHAILAEHTAPGVRSAVQLHVAGNGLKSRTGSTRQAMTPLARVAMIEEDADRERVEEVASRHDYSRLVVHATGDHRRIVGFIDVVQVLLDEEPFESLRRFIRPAVRLDADRLVSTSLVAMQEARCPLGVVYDARGRAAGIVTLKDLAEEIVGESRNP